MTDQFEGTTRTLRRFRLEDEIALLEQRIRHLRTRDERAEEHLGVLGDRLAHRRAELADLDRL